jgi:hypothetical protein
LKDKNKFNKLLNALAGLNGGFAIASGPFPARKACAVCPSPSGGMSVARPANFFVSQAASGCPNPVRRWNATKQVPAVGSGQADWVTCIMTASGNSSPVPQLWYIRTDGSAPNQANAPASYWVEVRNIGYGF